MGYTEKKYFEKGKEIVLKNHHNSLRDLASELNTTCGTAQYIIVNILSMRRVADRLAPKDLTFVEKYHQKTVAEDLISEMIRHS